MKKIILLLILLTGSQLVKSEPTIKSDIPSLTIVCNYSDTLDTNHFINLKNDSEFCCNFIVTSGLLYSEDVTVIKHTSTGVVLGTFYGRPSKKFIIDICNQMGYFDQNNVDKIVESFLKLKK
jgi:hypothetical protein